MAFDRFLGIIEILGALGALVLLGGLARAEPPTGVILTQSVVTLPAATDTALGTNTGRKSLCLMNIGTGLVTLNFGAVAVAGSGVALEPASAAGHQGGSWCPEGSVIPDSAIHGISTAGSVVAVIEGR